MKGLDKVGGKPPLPLSSGTNRFIVAWKYLNLDENNDQNIQI